jgi:vancomycin resistance protein VanW
LASYWKADEKKGYVDGMVLFYGSFRKGIGGGLCQLSNLLYWITLHTPLKVTERHQHSYDVFPEANRTQPFGIGTHMLLKKIVGRVPRDLSWKGAVI